MTEYWFIHELQQVARVPGFPARRKCKLLRTQAVSQGLVRARSSGVPSPWNIEPSCTFSKRDELRKIRRRKSKITYHALF